MASPSLCLLGDTSAHSLTQSNKIVFILALTTAKKTILMNWKSKNYTNIVQWKKILLVDHICLENLCLSVHKTIPSISIWSQLITFLQTGSNYTLPPRMCTIVNTKHFFCDKRVTSQLVKIIIKNNVPEYWF